MDITEYYNDQGIRGRMAEFLGGHSLEDATCVYLTRGDNPIKYGFEMKTPTELGLYLEEGLDISRSLWDRKSLIVHLDLEYVNFDAPAEPYLDPLRTFTIQQPVVLAVETVLLDYGIAPLHLLSGRGHHFVWQVRRQTPAFERLTTLGHVPRHLQERYAAVRSPAHESLDPEVCTAFAGLGLVIEYVAHRVQEEASPVCQLLVELTDVAVEPQRRGREMVSIDISEYGDPLNTRVIRIPFSVYLKPWQNGGIFGDQSKDTMPHMFFIPLHEMDVQQGLLVMRDASETAKLARRASVQIPDQSSSMVKLISAYEESDLATFHQWFYAQDHDPPERWPDTYDRTPLDTLPPCVRYSLDHPNDLLLQPAGIRHLVRVLLAMGWYPRHIAGLIRSKFERDYGWGEEWYTYDAATRADFYTRVFG